MARHSTSELVLIAGTGSFLLVLLAVLTGAGATADLLSALAIGGAGRSAPWLVDIFSALTWIGDAPVRFALAGLVAAGLVVRGRLRSGLWLLAVVVSGAGMASLLKVLVARPRPEILGALDSVSSASFPSGHAWNAVILFGALALLAPARWRGKALVATSTGIFLIGVSRVVLGVHWPSDVLAGWIGGVAWLALGVRLRESWFSEGNRR